MSRGKIKFELAGIRYAFAKKAEYIASFLPFVFPLSHKRAMSTIIISIQTP